MSSPTSCFTTVLSPLHSPHFATSQFGTDFFAILHGVEGFHPDIGPTFAADTAVWGYGQIRQRKYYWVDKKKLMERIVRSTNIALWQKQRDSTCTGGVYVDGAFAIFGEKMAWMASFGRSSIYIRREQGEQWLMGNLARNRTAHTMPLGKKRYEFLADIVAVPLDREECFVFGVGDAADQPVEVYAAAAQETDDVSGLCSHLFGQVCRKGQEWGVTCIRRSAISSHDAIPSIQEPNPIS